MIYITDPSPDVQADAQPLVLWDNVLTRGALQTSTEGGAETRANALTESTFDFWQPTAYPATLGVLVGAVTPANCAFFASHDLAGHLVEVVRLQTGGWVTVTSVTPASNDPFLIIFNEAAYSNWGVRIAGGSIGVVMIGKRLTIPGGVVPDYVPIWGAREIKMLSGATRRGQFVTQRVESVGASVEAELAPIPYSFVKTDMAGFRAHYDAGRPFVWAAAPSVFPEDVAYVWATGPLRPSITAGGLYCNISLSMQAYAE